MKHFPLKWKLSLSFIGLSLGFIGLYVYLAKETFEFDKISYIFESQQREIEIQSRLFQTQVAQTAFEMRAVLNSTRADKTERQYATTILMQKSQSILGIRVFDLKDSKITLSIGRPEVDLNVLKIDQIQDFETAFKLTHLKDSLFILTIKDALDPNARLYAQALVDFPKLFPNANEGQFFALIEEKTLIRLTEGPSFDYSTVQNFVQQLSGSPTDSTIQKSIGGVHFLISSVSTGIGKFRYLSFVKEEVALGALKLLFQRSILFVLFSVFATTILAVLLSNQLTRHIMSLTMTAKEISTGHFDARPNFESRDEIGILAQAFIVMAAEIKRLIAQVIEKTRMEQELKTARLVQDNLFPKTPSTRIKNISVAGALQASTECSGDWWYYFQKADKIYVLVADATGHGTPAALITAAARSVFSLMEKSDIKLEGMMKAWDEAIYACSNGSIFMTGFIIEVNAVTGEATYINSSHESPLLIDNNGEASSAEYLDCPINHRLGESGVSWNQGQFILKDKQRLLIYSDGIFTLNDEKGRPFSERKFIKLALECCAPGQSSKAAVDGLLNACEEMSEGKALDDDISFVIIENNSSAA